MKEIMIILFTVFSFFFACNSSQKEMVNTNSKNDILAMANDTSFNRHIIYSSIDKGLSWQASVPGLPADTEASFFEKKENEIVLGTDNHGLFISENNRSSWKNIGTNLPSKKINALHVSGEEIYVGLYNHGIFLSVDNGEKWTSLNNELPNLNVQGIIKLKDEILVGTDDGIFKTEENKIDWKLKQGGLQILSLQVMDQYLISGSSRGILLSNDLGETWETIHDEGAIHYTSVVGETIFGLYMSGDVFRSEDMGKSWVEIDYAPRYRSYVYELIGIDEDIIMANSYGVFRSVDKGKIWNRIFIEERFVFFDFVVIDDIIYGCTRHSDEFRNRD